MISERIHGGSCQYNADQIQLDLSVNINPYGPSPEMLTSLKNCRFDQYPDPNGSRLKAILAQHHDCHHSQIHLGNGAAEIFWTIVRSQLHKKLPVLILEPTFSEFRLALESYEFPIYELRSHHKDDFHHHTPHIQSALCRYKIKMAYICNPNSPTGSYFDPLTIINLAQANPQVTFILDQAFIQLSPHYQDLYHHYPKNIIQVVSLTKEHSIPGVRIAYAVGSVAHISHMNQFINTWNVNSFALQAGMVATSHERFVRKSYESICQDKAYVCQQLDQLGLTYHTKDCPFILIQVGDSTSLFQQMKKRGILVRDCSSYELENWIRIFPRPIHEIDLFFSALKSIL